MSSNGKMDGWIDGTLYSKNRRDFPLQELQKYAGQWVAFSADGTRIVASHPTMLGLCDLLDKEGIDSMSVVLSEIHADEVGLE